MNIQTKLFIPLLIIFAIMLGIVTYVNYNNQKAFVEKVFRSQATQTAYQYFDSVNSMMITGTMDKREILRTKLLENKEILDVRMVRGQKVVDLFGEGYGYEKPQDDLDAKALNGESIEMIKTINGKRQLTLLIPMRASTNYKGTNCIECHQVPEKTILGATRISYSLEHVDNEIWENCIYVGKILAGLFGAALVIVIISLRLIAIKKLKSIQENIKQISEHLDLTKRLDEGRYFKDEISKLSHAFNSMLKIIHESMSEVQTSTNEIVTGSNEISNLVAETVTDIQEQSDETNKVALSIGKMSESSQKVAQSTHQSQSFTNIVEQEVTDGASKSKSATEKINNLYEQIEKVSEIAKKLEIETLQISQTVKVIDDITLKTKLLSFNASVEAARAGEHGKGFTVVASEIGELAEQTKKSNFEIENGTIQLKNLMNEAIHLINETKKLAEDGKDEVNISYNSFNKVAHEMTKLREVIAEIAQSTQEQSDSTRAIEKNIYSIMELSKKTNLASERIGSVSANFSHLAHKLDELIKRFKI